MPADRGAPTASEAADDEAFYEAYFQELNDGCGCTEIWEYLSERRQQDSGAPARE